jgi:hypothetical protein
MADAAMPLTADRNGRRVKPVKIDDAEIKDT